MSIQAKKIKEITEDHFAEIGPFTGLDQIWTLIEKSSESRPNTTILISGFMFSADLAALLLVDCFELTIATTESGFFVVCAVRLEDRLKFPSIGLNPSDHEYRAVFEAGEFPLIHVFQDFGKASACLSDINRQTFDWGRWYRFGTPDTCYTVLSLPDRLSLLIIKQSDREAGALT